jgi:putative PIN family toxin of toxin-antitoxin system
VGASFVLDTDVLVAALRSGKGASRQLLLGALGRQFELLLSVPLMLEYESVLTRPEHLEASSLSADDVSVVLDDLAFVARQVKLAFRWRPQLQDPGDDMALETAVNGDADAIVTFNQSDFRSATKTFTFEVLSPGDVLRRIKRTNS